MQSPFLQNCARPHLRANLRFDASLDGRRPGRRRPMQSCPALTRPAGPPGGPSVTGCRQEAGLLAMSELVGRLSGEAVMCSAPILRDGCHLGRLWPDSAAKMARLTPIVGPSMRVSSVSCPQVVGNSLPRPYARRYLASRYVPIFSTLPSFTAQINSIPHSRSQGLSWLMENAGKDIGNFGPLQLV